MTVPDPAPLPVLPPGAVPDEVLLLAEIIIGRSEGSNDMRAGTSDEDLSIAIEEALPYLQRMREALDA